VIPIKHEVTFLVGGDEALSQPYPPYNALQCHFLDRLSVALRSNADASQYNDVMGFAFWCRKGNISSLRSKFEDGVLRLGLGTVFHIAPSNVPVNFAFSYAIGLLAGNANYVRLPSKAFPQVEIICSSISKLLLSEEFKDLSLLTHFFRYDHSNEITAKFSSNCEARIIWGSDETIRSIRQHPITVRGIDIAFSDRFSFCVIKAVSLDSLTDIELEKLAIGFFNDTFLMDQNACSSPHLIVWLGTPEEVSRQKEKFWSHVQECVRKKYSLTFKAAVDKQLLLCQNAIELEEICTVNVLDSTIFRIDLSKLPNNLEAICGHCGYFYEYATSDLNSIAKIINVKYQTLTYFGIPKSDLVNFILKNRVTGIDRIVPLGMALDIGTVWDGIDLIRSLSRIIDVK
jgi:hypothetical protein